MKTVIFDLDGTLCDITHRLRHIKQEKPDWDLFFADCVNDEPKWEIIELFNALERQGYVMRIVSGRSDRVELETVNWLEAHGIRYDELIMRKDGDYTPDCDLKKQWLHDGVLGAVSGVLFCVDDRQRVVDMWREEGLTCLQVAAWEE